MCVHVYTIALLFLSPLFPLSPSFPFHPFSLSLSLKGRNHILSVAKEIAEAEISIGLQTSVEDYQKEFKFGLIEVVHKWAQGEVSVTMTTMFLIKAHHH